MSWVQYLGDKLIKLDDIYYFSIKKLQHPVVYELVEEVVDISNSDPLNKIEIQKKLNSLSRTTSSEHLRQCTNFLAEALTF